jgi:RNA polymerase sigma-70 factor (ECF subfamily)
MLENTGLKTNPSHPLNTASLAAELFERYRPGIYRYLYYRVGEPATAEDLTSEVFLRMVAALPGYRAQNATHQAWLYQIARNLAIDHFRKMNVRREEQWEDHLQTLHSDEDATMEKRLTSQTLRRALGQIPEVQREVIILRFITGMPVAEVAQTLHKSIDSVKSLQRRALLALRDMLTDWEVVYG